MILFIWVNNFFFENLRELVVKRGRIKRDLWLLVVIGGKIAQKLCTQKRYISFIIVIEVIDIDYR